MDQKNRIGIVAPSSKVPQIELKLGIKRIENAGFDVDVHPQVRKSHLFFAGNDQERAGGFFEYAQDSSHSVIWCARGGHGAIRLLPILEKLTAEKGVPPKKLLVGYSDVTALIEFVRSRWGWDTLHAPVPSIRKFSLLGDRDWNSIIQWIRGEPAEPVWKNKKLSFWANPPAQPIDAKLIGGNLTVWNCLTGTRFQPISDDCILFFEDVDESIYRMDRMLHQMAIAGSIQRIRGIVLGNFLNCRDHVTQVLKSQPSEKSRQRVLSSPKPSELQPLRKSMSEIVALKKVWGEIGSILGVPVAFGLPVGHGPEISPLPLGAQYRLHPSGKLELLEWDWLKHDRISGQNP